MSKDLDTFWSYFGTVYIKVEPTRGLPYMTSALRGGGQKIPQFCKQTEHKIQTKGEEGSKNPNFLRKSYMEAPNIKVVNRCDHIMSIVTSSSKV